MTVDLTKPNDQDSISLEELNLYHAIIAYRVSKDLSVLPLSKALSATAGRHVVDWRENIWGEGKALPDGDLSLHSWSDADYPEDHSNPEAMWEAPERLGTGYESSGYEIAAVGFKDTDAALEAWKDSPTHNAILADMGVWEGIELKAIGIGVDTSPGPGIYDGRGYSVWFGQSADPEVPEIHGTENADDVIGTDFSDVILSLEGDDAVASGRGDDEVRGGDGDDRLSGNGGDDLLYGNNGDDRLYGGGGADKLIGGGGDDRLLGGGGVDSLHGGSGRDTLIGGGGADFLTGGNDEDVFVFRSINDSTPKAPATIVDFELGVDRLDLSEIDANALTDAHDAFDFIGRSRFDGVAGQLRRDDGVIEADVDGDGAADMRIELQPQTVLAEGGSDGGSDPVEVAMAPNLSLSDFIL